MKHANQFTTVTPFSRGLALSMLVIFPILAFLAGMKYQKAVTYNFLFDTKENVTPAVQPQKYTHLSKVFFPAKGMFGTIFITDDSSGSSLYISDNDMKPENTKLVHTFPSRDALGFDGQVFVQGNYGMASYSGGDAVDILIFHLNGDVITDSVSRMNPELQNWSVITHGHIVKDGVVEVNLGKISNEQATADIEIATGKMVPGSFKKL
jgi:hypothetical protein